MTVTKVLCFELFGDYAQFKKYFTNMSPLSFSIPPRTVLAGIIGAILGINKDVNPEHFDSDKSFISLKLINPVKKTRIAHNYIKTDSINYIFDIKSRKPTNVEFLKNVRYKVYFSCKDDIMYQKLKDYLSNHQSIYTISLGISGCLANYEYLGEYDVEKIQKSDNVVEIDSIIPLSAVKELKLDKPLKLQKAVVPANMENNRRVTRYEEVLFEMNGEKIPLISKKDHYLVTKTQERIYGF
jgi:CRISPR-associated protein Cas5h